MSNHSSLRRATRRARILAGALAACLAMSVSGCGRSESDSSTVRVAVTTPSWNAGFATFLLSQAEGYFEDEGIDVEFTLPPSGTQAAQQVIAGNADVALVTPEPVIIGATQGTDLTYFASYYGDWIYGLAALEGSGIADLADLKGKRIGVTTVASSGTTFARTALRSAGVDPDDVTFVPIGVGAQQITAIKAGNVDALALWDTQYQIVKNAGIGLEDLAVPGMGDMYGGGFAASKSQLEKDPDKFVKFGRAFAKGVVLAESDPEAAIKAMWKEQPDTAAGPGAGGLDEQVRVLQVRLDGLGVPEGKQEWGLIDMTRVQHAIDFAEKSALIKEPVKAESIVDTGLLDEINDFSRDEVVGQAGKQ